MATAIKIKIDREMFHSKISKMIKFVPDKMVIPAFENFKLSVANGFMEITSADSTIQCKMLCPVSKSEPFEVCVPAKLLVKTIGLFVENEVVITLKSEKAIEIKSGKSKYNITSDCLPKDFPIMKMGTITSEITLGQFFLKAAFKSAKKFIDEDGANSNIIGVNIQEIDNNIIFTGADMTTTCRVAIKPVSINKWESIVCMTDTANNVSSLLDDRGEVSMVNSGDMLRFFTSTESSDFFEVTSVAANAKFPNTEMMFSKMPPDYYVINSMELLGAAKRLKLYANKDDVPKITFKVLSDTELELSSEDTSHNKSGTEIITYENKSGQALSKTFNADNLTKILSIVEANEFKLHFDERLNYPSYIIPSATNSEENIYSFLLTSMKI